LIEIQIPNAFGKKKASAKKPARPKGEKHLLRALQRKRKLQIKNDIKILVQPASRLKSFCLEVGN